MTGLTQLARARPPTAGGTPDAPRHGAGVHRHLEFQYDQQGVVFNMWYFGWFDDAMTQFLGEVGYPYRR